MELITQEQKDVAMQLYQRLANWHQSVSALEKIGIAFPNFDIDSCLIKTVAINGLYSTNLYAIVDMAQHIQKIMSQTDINTANRELVNNIAEITLKKGKNDKITKRFTSFASKFCNFFVNEKNFPIYDDAARTAVQFHVGVKDICSYNAFCENLFSLCEKSGLKYSRDIDCYLWITGMYLKWKKNRDKKGFSMNVELKKVFDESIIKEDPYLKALLHPSLTRHLMGDYEPQRTQRAQRKTL